MYLKAYHFTRVMIYIHKLDQLTPGIADIESVSLIREIKSETRFPISEEGMKRKFTEFFVKEIFEWQNEFLIEITNVFNGLANIKSSQELLNFNERLNKIFMKILRN